MSNRKEKIQILADKLNNVIPLLDGFMNTLDDEEFDLLEETRDVLSEKINRNNGAMAIIVACGGNYDDTEDRLKIKTLDCIIELLKVRKEYKEEMIEKQKENENKKEVLKLFGMMGM